MFVWEWGMKAICLRARDGPEALACDEAQQPRPGEGEVLVRVHAAGVIHTELSWLPTWTNRAGEPRPLPVIPGHEFSGECANHSIGAGEASDCQARCDCRASNSNMKKRVTGCRTDG